jgi:hypothetical protein
MPLRYECPVCRAALSWWHLLRPLWSQWNCPACDSLLGIDVLRRLLGIGIYVPLALVIVFGLPRLGLPELFVIPIILVSWFPIFALTERPRVIERRGLNCTRCGYDLRGQTTPRCPECGRDLDERQRALLAGAAEPPGRRARPIAGTILVVVLLGAFLLIGAQVYFVFGRRRLPPATAPTSVPTTMTAPATAP